MAQESGEKCESYRRLVRIGLDILTYRVANPKHKVLVVEPGQLKDGLLWAQENIQEMKDKAVVFITVANHIENLKHSYRKETNFINECDVFLFTKEDCPKITDCAWVSEKSGIVVTKETVTDSNNKKVHKWKEHYTLSAREIKESPEKCTLIIVKNRPIFAAKRMYYAETKGWKERIFLKDSK